MNQQIVHFKTNRVLFDGPYPTLLACAEAAAAGISLDGADFTGANLVNADLDGASLKHARFTGANLMGANLSEAVLDGADFRDAGLQNACLCFSSVHGCRFDGASFGATDIAGCRIDRCTFDTLSALTLNFRDAMSMSGCTFVDDGHHHVLSRPPIVVGGLAHPVVLFDHEIKIGPWHGRLADTCAATPVMQKALFSALLCLRDDERSLMLCT